MSLVFAALLPVFLVILLGVVLRRTRLLDEAHWAAVDQLCYNVLFPALIFKEIAGADFTAIPVAHLAGAMILAVVVMGALLLVFRTWLMPALSMQGAQFASFFQGATRWHTFIALAIIPPMFGNDALALGALSAATMTPVLNVLAVWVHARFAQGRQISGLQLLGQVARNPFVTSSLSGVIWQVLGLPLPWPVSTVLDITSKGALGLALLAVGAGLRFEALAKAGAATGAAVVLKLLAMPLIMWGTLRLMGVSGEAAQVALVCSAVPTGSGAYVLARKMDGDAAMVANILTLQVLAAAFTIPLVLTLAG